MTAPDREDTCVYDIVFATDEDETELRGIFLDENMDIAGEMQEHVLIQEAGEIIGGGMLTQTGEAEFHLLVFAVKGSARSHGAGSILLRELIGQPWRYSRNGTSAPIGAYTVTTAAKGKSSGFYRKNGFVTCAFSDLAAPFDEQCRECPDRDNCNPVPMRYAGCVAHNGPECAAGGGAP
ncbi:GNAT family N-acetyltransferase [Geobacter sp. FeAm09]|uniref:GNAT family N-acetyltransferase n=1 Tax=Geobacter sp. FeAm09 TaxID=2597769 RepID=UPI00143D169C|nr:GNAT family N-acetyltransferase [Geobacter sp. FeAm09]